MDKNNFAEMINFTLNNKVYKRETNFKENIAINKKKILLMKLKLLYENIRLTIKYLTQAIEQYRELINKTEYYENKTYFNFNFEVWNELKKTRGHITRYLNSIILIGKVIKEEINDYENQIQKQLQPNEN